MTLAATDSLLLSPKSKQRLVAVFALTNSIGYIAMVQTLPVVLIPMADDLGTSRTAIAAATTVSTLMGAFAALPVGRVLDRVGGRALMATGSGLGAASVLLWSQAQSLLLLYGAFALIGLALSMSTYEASFAVLAVSVEPPQRNQSILTVTMIVGLATYLVYPLVGWLNIQFGWRTTVIALAVTLAVTAVPAHVVSVPSRTTHRGRIIGRSGAPLGTVLRQSRFWLLTVAFVAQAASSAAFLLLGITYLIDRGHSVPVATSVLISVGVLQIVARLILTVAGSRLSFTVAAAVSFAIQGVGLLMLPLVGLSIPLTLLCVAAVGLGQGVAVVAKPAMLADTFGVLHFASVLAAITVPTALARAGSPLLAAWLGDWRFLVGCGVLSLIAAFALLVLLLRSTRSAGESSIADRDGDPTGTIQSQTCARTC